MTTLRDGVDIAAFLQESDVFLCSQDGGDVESVMRQIIPA